MWGTSGTVDVPLPTDKLSASMPHDIDHHPVVLVNCGSFNPPTIMHLRMFDVAAQVLEKVTVTFLLHNCPMHCAHQRAYALPYCWEDAQPAHAQILDHESVE